MKKLILVLAFVLIASPAFGDPNVSVTLLVHDDTNTVDIKYNCDSAKKRPRAFALEVEIVGDAKCFFKGISNYYVGESNSIPPAHIGYGIYPARMTFKKKSITTVEVNYPGRPEADQNDVGVRDQKFDPSSRAIVLEFASLWFSRTGEANAPPLSGTLCTLTFDCNGATGNPLISAKEEDTYRGGIVLENSTPIDVTITSVPIVCGCTRPGQATNLTPANGATGISRTGTNLTWTAGALATSHNVYLGTVTPPTTRVAMVPMPTLSYATGPLNQGSLYYWRIDANNGCPDPCAGAIWNFTVEECVRSGVAPFYTVWLGAGKPWKKPNCWCYRRNCRGDFDGLQQLGLYWVYSNDLTALRDAYTKIDSQLTGNRICADFKRDQQLGLYRVYSNDLVRLRAYYSKFVNQIPCCDEVVPTDCTLVATDNYVFWTN